MKKKMLLLILVAIVLSNCEIKVQPKQAKAQETPSTNPHEFVGGPSSGGKIAYVYIDNMRYAIMSTYYGVTVVNLTKDAAEVKYYQQKLNK